MGFMDFLESTCSAIIKHGEETLDGFRRQCKGMSNEKLLQVYHSLLIKSGGDSSMVLDVVEDELRRRHIKF